MKKPAILAVLLTAIALPIAAQEAPAGCNETRTPEAPGSAPLSWSPSRF